MTMQIAGSRMATLLIIGVLLGAGCNSGESAREQTKWSAGEPLDDLQSADARSVHDDPVREEIHSRPDERPVESADGAPQIRFPKIARAHSGEVPQFLKNRSLENDQSAATLDTPILKPPVLPPAAVPQASVSPRALLDTGSFSHNATDGTTRVEVFFATDRRSATALGEGQFTRTFGWPLAITGLVLLLGTVSVFSRRKLPALLACVAAVFAVSTGYNSLIDWQRLQRLDRHGDVRYTSELRRDPTGQMLDYGTCVVSIPPDHRVGHVDSPSLQRFEFSEDHRKHVILERVVRGPREEFFQQLNDRLEQGGRDTFVFIHGYNVSFESAVKRTAQIAFDLRFPGVPICYSWPSHGELENYTRDMANADWTVIHLQEFLTSLFDETEATRIHLIAHSMGNRALVQALDRLSLQWNREGQQRMSLDSDGGTRFSDILERRAPPRFGQIIMAAPDVGAGEFRQRYAETVRKLSDRVTLYASSRDRALMVSTSVHGHNRAGLTGDEICIVDGIDTIDVSHIDTSLIGHSYYGDNPALIDDLRALIQLSRTTSERSWLEQVRIAADKAYWKFR